MSFEYGASSTSIHNSLFIISLQNRKKRISHLEPVSKITQYYKMKTPLTFNYLLFLLRNKKNFKNLIFLIKIYSLCISFNWGMIRRIFEIKLSCKKEMREEMSGWGSFLLLLFKKESTHIFLSLDQDPELHAEFPNY